MTRLYHCITMRWYNSIQQYTTVYILHNAYTSTLCMGMLFMDEQHWGDGCEHGGKLARLMISNSSCYRYCY